MIGSQYVRGNPTRYLPTSKIRIDKSAAQNFAHTVWTKVQFDKVIYDVDGEWDAANYRFVAKVPGYYLAIMRLSFTPVAQNEILFQGIYRNITTWYNADLVLGSNRDVIYISAACCHCVCCGIGYLAAGDHVEGWGQFTSVDGLPTAIDTTVGGNVFLVIVKLA